MQYGVITIHLNREPVEVGILVEGQQQSGPFIASRLRRGVAIADTAHTINLTIDEALVVLEWLQDRAPVLRAMADEESAALDAVAGRRSAAEAPGRPGRAEGDRATIEADLSGKEAKGQV